MIHCGYTTFGLNRADAEFCVVTRGLPRPATLALVRAAAEAGHTVALMSPYDGCERQALCGQIVAEHASTTVAISALEAYGLSDKNGIYKAIGAIRSENASGLKIGSYWSEFDGTAKKRCV